MCMVIRLIMYVLHWWEEVYSGFGLSECELIFTLSLVKSARVP